MTPSIRRTANEIVTYLYALRTARELLANSVAHGDHAEARRHDKRRYDAAQTIRNIIRERPVGIEAYHVARMEFRP